MKKLIIFFSQILFFVLGLSAETINLEQVRTLALLNSRTLERTNMALRSSLLEERNQFFSRLPSISMGYNARINYLDNDWGFVDPIDTFNSSLNLEISYRIFDGGRNLIQRDLSAISTESARRDALAEYFNVLDSVDSAYYEVLEAIATLESEESTLQTAIFSLSMAEIRQASGMINQGDYLRALADKELRENSRNQARRNLSLAITRLNSLTGLPYLPPLEQINFSHYEVLINHLGNITDGEADILYGRLWSAVSASNLSLARAVLNSQRAELNHSITKRESAPVITASIISPSISYSTEHGFRNQSGAGAVSITGTIPIDFWIYGNRLERSRIALESAAVDYRNTEISLEIELYSAILNCFGMAGSVLSSRRTLDYVEMHFEFVMERYRLLQSSISDLQEASTMLINSQNSHTRALFGFLQSLSRLRSLGAFEDEEKLVGILLGELL